MAQSKESVVPVIDLEDSSLQSSKKLLEACETLGCFRVVNHKIPLQLLSEMKSVVRHLLDLPTETKRRNTDTIAGSGYIGPSPTNPLYEALGLYDVNSSEAVDAFCEQLEATPHQRFYKIWASNDVVESEVWRMDYMKYPHLGMKETIKSYASEMHQLAMDIAHKITKSLGIEGDVCIGWPMQFRINKYSFTEESVGSLGVQLHTDSTFLTILQEDERVGGLEVMNNNGGFIPVQPNPGSLLVNLGDIAKDLRSYELRPKIIKNGRAEGHWVTGGGCKAWSNGRLCNVKHRVQCKEATIRVSIAVFLLGSKEKTMEAPPELVDADHPRLYIPFTYGDYRKRRVSGALHTGEALELYTMDQA